jgi:type II secretory pathway component GspD/PulD (secretin)/tetratricopeptide (TPR) repeat protein
LALSGAAEASLPPVLAGLTGAVSQAPARPLRAHAALNNGVESYRRGDYESAAAFIAQAQASQDDLSEADRKELATLIQLNNDALNQRQEGRKRLRDAELAATDGRNAEAEALLRSIANNQFLSTDDKLKVQKLYEILSPGTPMPQSTTMPNKDSLAVVARTKLQQARTMLARGDYEAAERVAHEVEGMHVQFPEREDSPRKVLDDVARARKETAATPKDPKGMLLAARAALDKGDLETAERLAHEAEKSAGLWTFTWGDNPKAVLKDVQLARVRLALEGAKKDVGQPKKDAPQSKQNQFVSGQQIDNMNNTGKPAPTTLPTDPHDLLKLGRDLYASNNLDEAEKMAQRAKEAGGSWGIFKDNPDKLLNDIKNARKEESVRVLAEARQLFSQGQYEEAKVKAQRAETMHGPYSRWERGDRPQKLLAEIEAAQPKTPQTKAAQAAPKAQSLPPMPMYDASNELKNSTPTTTVKTPNNSSMLVKPSMPPAPSTSSPMPVVSGGYQIPDEGQLASMNRPAPANPMMDMPRKESTAAMPVMQGGMQTQIADRRTPAETPRPPAPVENPNKPEAKRLLAEAKQEHLAGNLVEARKKVLEAQRLNVQFSMDEERPEIVLLQLTESAKKQVDALCQQATDYTLTADRDGKRYKMAEEALVSARRLAAGFALDTQPVDVKMAWVRQTIDHNQGGTPPVLQVQHQETSSDIPSPPSGLNMPIGPQVSKVTVSAAPPATAPAPVASQPSVSPPEESYPLSGARQDGQALLDKAREQLRKGDTDGARRLAVEAFNGPFGVRDQADAVIHSIDAEEISQKSLAANRSYEAGLTAFQRKDYALAGSIFQSVDVVLLPPEKQAKLRELLQLPEMQTRVTQTGLKGGMATSETTAGATRVSDGGDNKPKRAPLEETYSQQVQALQEVQFQKLRDEGLRVQREAMERAQAGETDRAIQLLETYLEGLKGAQLEPQRVALLRRPVESRLQNFKTLKAQQDFEAARSGDKKTFVELRESQAKAEQHKQQLVMEQMKKYHAAYKEGRYAEAETYAMKAHELDPDNTQAAAAMEIAHMARNQAKFKDIKDRREDQVLTQLDEAEDEGPVVTGQTPLKFDKERWQTAGPRKEIQLTTSRTKNEKDREIESKLIYPLSLNFKNTPFRQVVEDLRTWTGINIVVDKRALEEDNISMDQPVEMNLNGVMLKSALAEILHQMRLTYVIENECLNITTEAHAKGRLVLKTYQVADLVIPIEDHTTPTVAAMLGMQEGSMENHSMSTSGATPFTSQHSLPNGQSVSGSLSNQQSSPSTPASTTQPQKKTLEDSLIKLITNTIKPESWDSMGGPGTIDYFPLGMALTINQTPDIQEQVQELLHALRRLQDMEVAIEIRFITISEAFFERIGLDFNINIVTNNPKFENMVVSQQFAPFGTINKIHSDAVVGLQPTGTFTNTLDIPIGSGQSFNLAPPPFGGFPSMPGADGGLSLGLAFLSDIQVFLFMEAAQGDRRTNVMQAPKLTLQNAQTSTITVSDLQFFVTNVSFFLVNGQVVFVPTNTPIPTGFTVTMNAVVTADRRFVRMSIAPTLTNLATPVTALFPVTTFVTPLFEGGAQGQPVPFTMFLQQPGFTTVTVNTTVMVPDGGTVLMGGLKTLREGRNEFGPPILSKIPYINRLFKNVGYGRETESLLMMVTPRIIINEEEEAKQTGVGPGLGAEAAQPQQ